MSSSVLISESEIQKRVAALAAEIRRDHGPTAAIHLVAVLKGAFIFLADLMRQMEGEVTCDFIALSSYGSGTQSSGEGRVDASGQEFTRPMDSACAPNCSACHGSTRVYVDGA